ncbi:MAG: hypothetical protein AAGA56_22230 [Myxococcota bacterium]
MVIRVGLFGLLLGGFAALAPACNQMEQPKCMELRTQAFEVLTGTAHPCGSDADCGPSEWPGCAKPVSNKHREKIAGFKKQYEEGKCGEHDDLKKLDRTDSCREAPAVYCKQGLCVFREQAGATK